MASLTGSGNGSRTKETLTVAMRSVVRVMALSLGRNPAQGQESELRSRMRTVGWGADRALEPENEPGPRTVRAGPRSGGVRSGD
ncbi:hypothetical protein HOK021_63740 [Streptomyces hygroscopicus]|nr:hypothetical protein HOK021_63740 [Streptomyces hygroscopicus]